jgi:mRNA-degrading endonuclease RelE of RelBE toxin-antitoxin system
MKRISFSPTSKADVRAIDKQTAMSILIGLHRSAETGHGDVKALKGELGGLRRLRIGGHRVLFDETADAINVHRVRPRSDAYR